MRAIFRGLKLSVFILFLVAILGISVYYTQQNQDTRNRAAIDQEFLQLTPATILQNKKGRFSVVVNNLKPDHQYRIFFDVSYSIRSEYQPPQDFAPPSSFRRTHRVQENKAHTFMFDPKSCYLTTTISVTLSSREKRGGSKYAVVSKEPFVTTLNPPCQTTTVAPQQSSDPPASESSESAQQPTPTSTVIVTGEIQSGVGEDPGTPAGTDIESLEQQSAVEEEYNNDPPVETVVLSLSPTSALSPTPTLSSTETVPAKKTCIATNTKTTSSCSGASITLEIIPQCNEVTKREKLDIVVVFDRSGSMKELSLNPPQPITDAKQATTSFIRTLDTNLDRVGLVSFAQRATLDKQLTNTVDDIITTVNNLVADGGTNIAQAINTARLELTQKRRDNAKQIIVLLSDGATTWDVTAKKSCKSIPIGAPNICIDHAIEQAAIAKNEGITIITIGLRLGTIGGSFSDASLAQARKTLQQIASTEQMYYNAPKTEDLLGIFNSVKDSITNIVATNAEVIQTLPQGATFIPDSAIPEPNKIEGQTFIWNLNTITAESTNSLSFDVSLSSQEIPIAPNATIRYTDVNGTSHTAAFPSVIAKKLNCAANIVPTPTPTTIIEKVIDAPFREEAPAPTATPTPVSNTPTPTRILAQQTNPSPTLPAQSGETTIQTPILTPTQPETGGQFALLIPTPTSVTIHQQNPSPSPTSSTSASSPASAPSSLSPTIALEIKPNVSFGQLSNTSSNNQNSVQNKELAFAPKEFNPLVPEKDSVDTSDDSFFSFIFSLWDLILSWLRILWEKTIGLLLSLMEPTIMFIQSLL